MSTNILYFIAMLQKLLLPTFLLKPMQGKTEQNLTQLLKLVKYQQITVVTTTCRDFTPF